MNTDIPKESPTWTSQSETAELPKTKKHPEKKSDNLQKILAQLSTHKPQQQLREKY